MYYGFDPTIIILIPAIIFTIYAQGKVKSAYSTYSRIPVRSGITGEQTARMILNSNGMGHVPIADVAGELTDHYDPQKDLMRLSTGIRNGNSIAAVAIAAHESGHAIQDGSNYGFLKFRIAMVPVVNLVSGASWPLIIIGILMIAAGQAFGNIIFDIGVIMFLVVVLFHTITLPVEFNASKRALAQLTELGIVDETEIKGARKVLSAAAMTYVAALAVSILNLVRILAIRGSSN
ncbi:MAG: zinc metallopeptidase [Bacillota bacterium]|nr:zinc metallopeptidase [Bacillota bacterium]